MTTILDAVRPVTAGAQALFDTPAVLGMLIDGAWQQSSGGNTLETRDPATGRTIATIADASPADVDDAVAAARRAFPAWSQTVPAARAAILNRIADLIDAHIDELAELETLDQGKPLHVGRWAEIPGAVAQFRFFAGQAMAIEGRTVTPSITYQPAGKQIAAWTLREPVGVVAAIVPWNSPLVLTAMKLAPALAAGCTVVLKPAEDTSVTALRLGELMMQAGLPAGVLNIVTGRGAVSGAALAAHPGVDKIAFTGSTQTGRAIVDASRGNLKRITLELGGKSPVVILPDADLDLAIAGAANAIFFNAGQVCVAGSRAYVHASIYDRVMAGLSDHAQALQLGHGLNPGTQMGPLVSVQQATRVEGFIAAARSSGADIVAGGERRGAFGTFISPTVIGNVTPNMDVVREEIFGPVLVVQPYEDIEAVVEAANDSPYGLAASVWTQSLSSAHRLSRQIQAGTVWINCHAMYDPSLPIGGVKQSGYGRDSGLAALDNYLEWKTVCAVV
ncbi:aldehyde dehydrogenase family protein [Novosphingobium sp. BL-52-GroH]|uniref:aldehyde dehydrogenase family protein n=1 Tax=Novosphingobium sp. BL-52-GroH TaxID=3349877 RepID=UPI00384ECB2A